MDKIVIKLSKKLTDNGTEWMIASHTGLNGIDELHTKSSESFVTKPIFLDVNEFESIHYEDGVSEICSDENPLEVKPEDFCTFRLIEPVVLLRDCLAGTTFKSPNNHIVDDFHEPRILIKEETRSTDKGGAESDLRVPNMRRFNEYGSSSHNLRVGDDEATTRDNRKSFKCGECSASFIREYHFRRHQERHVNESAGNEIFHSVFSLRHRLSSVLRYNMKKNHHLNRPRRRFCQNGFSSKEDRAGYDWSSEVKISRYLCNVCPAQFEHEGRLKLHLSIHKERPFTCNVCFRTFTKKGGLNNHAKKHKIPARYICPVCYIEFSRKSFFKEHIQFHISF